MLRPSSPKKSCLFLSFPAVPARVFHRTHHPHHRLGCNPRACLSPTRAFATGAECAAQRQHRDAALLLHPPQPPPELIEQATEGVDLTEQATGRLVGATGAPVGCLAGGRG